MDNRLNSFASRIRKKKKHKKMKYKFRGETECARRRSGGLAERMSGVPVISHSAFFFLYPPDKHSVHNFKSHARSSRINQAFPF